MTTIIGDLLKRGLWAPKFMLTAGSADSGCESVVGAMAGSTARFRISINDNQPPAGIKVKLIEGDVPSVVKSAGLLAA